MISKLIETQPTKPRPAAEEPVLRAPKRPAPKHRVWPSLLVLAVLGGGGYFAYPWVVSILPKTGAAPKAKGPRGPVTVVTADGQYKDSSGEVVKEKSFVVVLLYPVRQWKKSNHSIEQIRKLYISAFQQESVLRVDYALPVRVSF